LEGADFEDQLEASDISAGGGFEIGLPEPAAVPEPATFLLIRSARRITARQPDDHRPGSGAAIRRRSPRIPLDTARDVRLPLQPAVHVNLYATRSVQACPPQRGRSHGSFDKMNPMPTSVKPRLFIGSSSESLPIVEILTEELADIAEVVPWTDPRTFPPTEYLTTSLLRAAASFDFGLFLFEPDDVVQSRERFSAVPRDNVVFELGLFMSHLGIKRAFPMAPRGRVKMLSDLAGFQPIVYEEPEEAAELKALIVKEQNRISRRAQIRQLKALLATALSEPIEQIRAILERQGPNKVGVVSPDAWNVSDVGAQVRRMVKSAAQAGPQASIRHLALDMAEFWKTLVNEILHERNTMRNLHWRCLMIDPESPAIKDVASSSVDAAIAARQIENMAWFMRENDEALKARGIRFECRLYQDPPMMHGFLVNGVALLWSMCNIHNGRLDGDNTPYWRFEAARDMLLSCHPANSFRNWFDHVWNHRSRDPRKEGEEPWPVGAAQVAL
jgi:predicted nucleotide-binding protein